MERTAYINGDYVPAVDAKISIFDRGFIFADSIYEVIPVYHGRAYFVERHLARLKTNLARAKIEPPSLDWPALFQTLIEYNGGGNLQLYLQITRGNQGARKHDIPKGLIPTVVAYTIHTPYPLLADKQQGLHAIILEDIRWLRCDIKTTSLFASTLLNEDAVSKGADTTILIRDGYITEGCSSNVFTLDPQGIIRTPPTDNLCLPGITRQLTIELVRSLGWPLYEEKITKESLLNSQEIWITSTTKEIYPVTRVNDLKIGNGSAGIFWNQINEKYQQLTK